MNKKNSLKYAKYVKKSAINLYNLVIKKELNIEKIVEEVLERLDPSEKDEIFQSEITEQIMIKITDLIEGHFF
jgi:transcriptional regulator NrdR family protein